MNVSEIPFDLPANLTETNRASTVAVSALAGRRVLAQAKAPDGYMSIHRTSAAPACSEAFSAWATAARGFPL